MRALARRPQRAHVSFARVDRIRGEKAVERSETSACSVESSAAGQLNDAA